MAGKIPAATVVDPASRPAPPRSQTQQAIGPPTADNLAPGGTVNRKKQKRRQKLAARQQQTDVEQDSVNYNLASGYALPSSANNLTHSYRQNGNGPAEDDEYEYDDEAGGSVYRGVAPTTHGPAHRRELVEQDDDIASSTYDASAQSRKKSKRKKSQTQQEQQYAEQQLRKQQQQQERHLLGTAASRAVSMMPPSRAQLAPSDDALRTVSRRISKDNIWDSSTDEERLRIRGFWYSLEEADRKSLVRIEKEAVLGKMKEQQKHSCSCTVCGRKRTAIEEELEILYDAYYDELEQYANNKQLDPVQGHAPLPADHPRNRRIIRDKATLDLEEDRERVSEADSELNDEDELDDDDDQEYSEEYSELTDDAYPDSAADFFTFGNSLTVQGGILTVADDLLKNDGSKFIEMMEQLAARRLAREHEATGQNKWQYAHAALDPQREHASHANHIHPDDPDEYDDDMEEDYDDDSQVDYDEAEDEMDQMNEHQRMEEGRRMFQIFAARMFEQRVVTAYREKAAKEKADRLIQELAEEENASTQQNAKKAREAEKKRIKKQQQKQAKAEEKARKEQEKAAAEAAIKEAEAKRQEELRLKREEQRKKKEAERKALEEEKGRKEAEKQKRLDAEREKQQEAERKAREIKAEEKRRKDEAKRKEREEREAREAAEQAARDKKAAEERKNREEERERREEERERRDREDKAKADARAAARAEARVRDRKYREEQEAIVVAHNEKWERAFAKLQAQSAEEVPRLTYETTAYGKMVSELPAEIEALRSPTPPSATTLASPAANIKTFLKPTVRPSQSKTEAASHGIPYRTPHLTPSPLLVEPISQPVKQPSPAKSLSSQQSSLGGSHNNITASQTMNQSRSFVSPPAAASSLHAIPPPPGISIQPNAGGLGGQMGLGGMNSFPIQHNGVMHGMNPRAPFPQHANTFPQQSHHPMPPQRQPFNSGLQHPQQYGQQHGQQHGPQQPQQQSQRGHQYQKQYPLGQPPPGYMDLRTLPPHSFSMAPMSHRKTRPDQERGVGMTAYGGIDMPDWNTLSQRQAAAATPREAVHGRQQSASFEGNAAFSEAPGAATRPIGKPAGPIKPPSISKAHEDHKSRDSDVEDLAHHLGSAALLAESEKEEDGGTPFLPAPRRTAGAPSLMSIGANQFNNRNVPPFGAPSRPVASDIWARAASRMGNFGVRGRNLDTLPPYFREYHGLAMHLQPGQPLSPIYPQGWAAVQHHPPADVPRHHGTPMAALSLSPNGPLPTRTEVVRGLLKLTCQGLEERNPADGFCDLAEAMSVTQDTARLSQGAYTIPTVEEIRIVAEIPGNVDNGEGYFTLRDHPQHGPGIRWDPYNGSTLPINGMRNPANLPHNNGGSLISREIEYSMVNAAAASAAGMAHAAVGEPGDGSGLGSGPRRGF